MLNALVLNSTKSKRKEEQRKKMKIYVHSQININNNIAFKPNTRPIAQSKHQIKHEGFTPFLPAFAYLTNSKAKISFKSKADSVEFNDWLKSQTQTPKEVAQKTIENEVVLGEGTENIVYQIPNNDSFVLRVPKTGFRGDNLRLVDDEFEDINIGQTIATIGNSQVRKKQLGEPAGVLFKDRVEKSGYENIFSYRKHVYQAAQMPQESYDELAKTLKLLNDKGYAFDMYNPNNILIDSKNKKFNIVDDFREITDDKDENTFASIAMPLLDTWFMNGLSYTEDYIDAWQEIIIKSMKAANKEGLPAPQKDLDTLNNVFEFVNMGSYK